jgi:hypothetical protein
VLAHGDEAGLASPLADSVLLATAAHLPADGPRVVAAVFGAGCDGELTPAEVLARIAEVAGRGGWLGTAGIAPDAIAGLEAAVAQVPPRRARWPCAARAATPGRRRSARAGARRALAGRSLTFFLDPRIAMATAARLADAVVDAPTCRTPTRSCTGSGCAAELDYEIDAAGS